MTAKFIPFKGGLLEHPEWEWDPERHVFGNPHFGQVFHVIFNIDGNPRNDQMLRVEQSPGCFIPLNKDDEIGLVQHALRPQVKDMTAHLKAWPYDDPAVLTESLGRASWEIPRGYAKLGESGADAAAREGSEETDTAVVQTAELGQICGNTAMEPHFMTVVAGLVDENKIGLPADPNERLITELTFFDNEELNILIRKGELYCGTTLSALRLLEAVQGVNRIKSLFGK